MEQSIRIQNDCWDLAAVIHYPDAIVQSASEEIVKLPVILICHGFIGSKTGVDRLFVKAARSFCDQGYITVRFDYAGCGESIGDYGESTFDSLLEQTNFVIESIRYLRATESQP